jgi:hypothetical protein
MGIDSYRGWQDNTTGYSDYYSYSTLKCGLFKMNTMASSVHCRGYGSCIKPWIGKYSRLETEIANGIERYAVADSGKLSCIVAITPIEQSKGNVV